MRIRATGESRSARVLFPTCTFLFAAGERRRMQILRWRLQPPRDWRNWSWSSRLAPALHLPHRTTPCLAGPRPATLIQTLHLEAAKLRPPVTQSARKSAGGEDICNQRRAEQARQIGGGEFNVPRIEARPRSHGARCADPDRDAQPKSRLLPQFLDVLGTVIKEPGRFIDLDTRGRLPATPLHPGAGNENGFDGFGRNAGHARIEPQSTKPLDPRDLLVVSGRLRTFARDSGEVARDRIQWIGKSARMHQQRADAN